MGQETVSDILFLTGLTTSGITGYKTLQKPPMTSGAEVELTQAVATADGEVLMEEFISPALGIVVIPAGDFVFSIYGSVDASDGVSELVGHVYQRTLAGVETELFNFTTGEIDATTATLYAVTYALASPVTTVITDRLVLKMYAKSSYATDITVSLYYLGEVNQSRIKLPVSLSKVTGGDMLTAVYDSDQNGKTESVSDVVGPAGATNGNLAVFDGVTGKIIKDGGAPAGGGDMTYAVIQACQLVNEVMNFPSLEGANDAQPEWWEKSANATLTEVDIAGEGITENYARGHKVVTAADAMYSYQRFTYADQQRIKSGRKLSAIFAVWSVGAKAARIRLQSSVGSLGYSVDTTAAAWTILKVEGVTLDGTYVDIRCEVDSGTAYFIPLGVNIGEKAFPLKPRGMRYKESTSTAQIEDLSNVAAHDWADLDCTAVTSNLAAMIEFHLFMYEDVDFYAYYARKNGSTRTGNAVLKGRVLGDAEECDNSFSILCDDGQIIETNLTRVSGAANLNDGGLYLIGWNEWE